MRDQVDNEINLKDIDIELRKKRGRLQIKVWQHSPPPVNRRMASLQELNNPDQVPQEGRDGQDILKQLWTFLKADERHGRRRSPGLV